MAVRVMKLSASLCNTTAETAKSPPRTAFSVCMLITHLKANEDTRKFNKRPSHSGRPKWCQAKHAVELFLNICKHQNNLSDLPVF